MAVITKSVGLRGLGLGHGISASGGNDGQRGTYWVDIWSTDETGVGRDGVSLCPLRPFIRMDGVVWETGWAMRVQITNKSTQSWTLQRAADRH